MSDGRLIHEAGDGPLCPQEFGPAANPWHQAANMMADRLYKALKKFKVNAAGEPDPEDGELPPELDKLYADVVYGDSRNRMYLHTESTSFALHRTFVRVESYHWRCHLCGFILPATTVTKQP